MTAIGQQGLRRRMPAPSSPISFQATRHTQTITSPHPSRNGFCHIGDIDEVKIFNRAISSDEIAVIVANAEERDE